MRGAAAQERDALIACLRQPSPPPCRGGSRFFSGMAGADLPRPGLAFGRGEDDMQFFHRLFARRFDPAAAASRAVRALQSALGDELVGVAAFGSWAVGEYVDGHSDLNLVVVTRRLEPDVIRRLAPVAASLVSPRCRPRYFSLPEFRRFADALPLEFQDMADTRKVLCGEDPFNRLEISASRLAEELENDARTT